MRKLCKRRVRAAFQPAMVLLATTPELGLAERGAIEALRGGWADYQNCYQVIADCHGMLLLAMMEKPCASTKAACDIGYIAIMNIHDRRQETGKYGATGDELAVLELLFDASEDYWKRQSGSLFFNCIKRLRAVREKQHAAARKDLKIAA